MIADILYVKVDEYFTSNSLLLWHQSARATPAGPRSRDTILLSIYKYK